MKRNDILWKAILEDLFDDFIRFFYPDADDIFDIDKGFEYLDKELDQLFPPDNNQFAPRYVDKLVKVFTKAGSEEWILIHIEVQGYSDQDFAKRMFQYYYRILDKYDKPVTAFAIFADTHKTFHPKFYERDFLGTKVHYAYNTYKIIDQPDEELEASNNPFAMAVLSAKLSLARPNMGDQQLFDLAFNLTKRLLTKQIPKEKIRKLMLFLRSYTSFDNQEMFTKFEQETAALTENRRTMGIEEYILEVTKNEGIQIGRQEGQEIAEQKAIKKVALKLKQSGIDIGMIANVTGLSEDEIEKLA